MIAATPASDIEAQSAQADNKKPAIKGRG